MKYYMVLECHTSYQSRISKLWAYSSNQEAEEHMQMHPDATSMFEFDPETMKIAQLTKDKCVVCKAQAGFIERGKFGDDVWYHKECYLKLAAERDKPKE